MKRKVYVDICTKDTTRMGSSTSCKYNKPVHLLKNYKLKKGTTEKDKKMDRGQRTITKYYHE